MIRTPEKLEVRVQDTITGVLCESEASDEAIGKSYTTRDISSSKLMAEISKPSLGLVDNDYYGLKVCSPQKYEKIDKEMYLFGAFQTTSHTVFNNYGIIYYRGEKVMCAIDYDQSSLNSTTYPFAIRSTGTKNFKMYGYSLKA